MCNETTFGDLEAQVQEQATLGDTRPTAARSNRGAVDETPDDEQAQLKGGAVEKQGTLEEV